MTELCQRYGIARETGYVWLRRYRERGVEGLVELNRAALQHPHQTAPETDQAVVELRQAHGRARANSVLKPRSERRQVSYRRNYFRRKSTEFAAAQSSGMVARDG